MKNDFTLVKITIFLSTIIGIFVFLYSDFQTRRAVTEIERIKEGNGIYYLTNYISVNGDLKRSGGGGGGLMLGIKVAGPLYYGIGSGGNSSSYYGPEKIKIDFWDKGGKHSVVTLRKNVIFKKAKYYSYVDIRDGQIIIYE